MCNEGSCISNRQFFYFNFCVDWGLFNVINILIFFDGFWYEMYLLLNGKG